MNSESKEPTPASPWRRRLPLLVLSAIACSVVIAGVIERRQQRDALAASAQSQAIPVVAVLSPRPVEAASIALPARLEAWASAPLNARVDGYLTRWSVDIGQSVSAGEVLAEIDTPELDRQLQQAQAELTRARGEAALAEATATRWRSLSQTGAVSRQAVDERVADASAHRSATDALRANVGRIRALQQYKRLTAPFDGVVTARNTDVGALISAQSATAPLFVVSDVRKLRVYVNVPQRQVAGIAIGMSARLTVPERPGETFLATVQSMARAIDASSGAMRVQLAVDNAEDRLLAGGYGNVQFEGETQGAAVGLPPSALLIGRDGVRIAVVDAGNVVELRPVTILRDLGRVVELAEPLDPSLRIIDGAPEGLASGDHVRVVATRTDPGDKT